jgi:hypothetical protein
MPTQWEIILGEIKDSKRGQNGAQEPPQPSCRRGLESLSVEHTKERIKDDLKMNIALHFIECFS